MDIQHYFEAPEEVKRMMRNKTLRNLEDLYIFEMTDEDAPDLSFQEFLDRTMKDMEMFENYEGMQILKDIKRYNGWK